jgi:hypothetical protein
VHARAELGRRVPPAGPAFGVHATYLPANPLLSMSRGTVFWREIYFTIHVRFYDLRPERSFRDGLLLKGLEFTVWFVSFWLKSDWWEQVR